jgi:hypothetical protein
MKSKYTLLSLLTLVIILVFTPSLPQNEAYHNFADQRFLFCCNNSLDVWSNLPFILFALIGLFYTYKHPYLVIEKVYLYTFFGSTILVGLGSTYYHLTPNSQTLIWDRLPMTIAFMSLLSLIMHIFDMQKRARQFFPWLLILGISSIIYWSFSNDLRPYLLVQFVPIAWLPYQLCKVKNTCSSYLWKLLSLYVIAKILELNDQAIFEFTHGQLSGHSLKHLFASFAVFMIVLMIKNNPKKLTGLNK